MRSLPLLLLLAVWALPGTADAGCTGDAELAAFERALFPASSCGPWGRVTGRCRPTPGPSCARASLAAFRELVPERPGWAWGRFTQAREERCRRAVTRGARRYLRERIDELRAGQRATWAGRHLGRAQRRCDGLPEAPGTAVGGVCEALTQRGERIDGEALRRCLSAALEGIAQEVSSTPLRPNIVLILTDDQRWDTLRYMPLTRQALAERGIEFENAFATTSLCCPDRATILTGLYAHDHGVTDNLGALLFDDSDTLPIWLQSGGYRTGIFGKYMNQTREALGTSIPPGWDTWQVFLDGQHLYLDYALSEDGEEVFYGHEPEHYSTDLLARRVIDFVAAEADRPFFALYAPFAPHTLPLPAERHAGAFAELPPWRPPSWREEDLGDKPPWVRAQRFFALFLGDVQIEATDERRRAQLETLLAVDEAVAAIDAELERQGLVDNTLVIFTSDNGTLWNEHWLTLKNYPYEESIRVPFLLRYPLRAPVARSSDAMVLHLDLAATFTGLAEVPPPPGNDGDSLLPLLEGEQARWRGDFLIEHFVASRFYQPTRGVRTPRWKYVETHSEHYEFFELYDLEADPYELENLAEDPALADLREKLATRLEELLDD